MKALIGAEWLKLYRQSRTYYALAAILVMEMVILTSAYFQGSDFIDLLLGSLKSSFYFKGDLLNGNLLIYLILNTLWFHLPLLLMIIVSGLLTSEYKDGTLQTVFLQPVSKVRFIAAKYVVAIVFTIAAVFFLILTAFTASYALFGAGDLAVYLDTLNFFEPAEAFRRLLLAYLSGTVTMIFYTAASLTLAVLFRDTIITWIVATFFLIVSNLLLRIDFGGSWINGLLYVRLGESWQYFFVDEIDWKLILKNNLLLMTYSLVLMGAGAYVFNRRDIL